MHWLVLLVVLVVVWWCCCCYDSAINTGRRRYCSKDCQRADWKAGHKARCAPPAGDVKSVEAIGTHWVQNNYWLLRPLLQRAITQGMPANERRRLRDVVLKLNFTGNLDDFEGAAADAAPVEDWCVCLCVCVCVCVSCLPAIRINSAVMIELDDDAVRVPQTTDCLWVAPQSPRASWVFVWSRG